MTAAFFLGGWQSFLGALLAGAAATGGYAWWEHKHRSKP